MKHVRSQEVAKLLEKAIDRPDVERIVHWVERRGYKIKDSELPSWYINGLYSAQEESGVIGLPVSRLMEKHGIPIQEEKTTPGR